MHLLDYNIKSNVKIHRCITFHFIATVVVDKVEMCLFKILNFKCVQAPHRVLYITSNTQLDTCLSTKLIYVSLKVSKCYGPLWVRGCRIGPTYPPACRKRRLIGGSLFAVGCDPCQWKRGSWLLSQFFVAALRRQYTALASISLSRKVKMAWLNQSAGSAKP